MVALKKDLLNELESLFGRDMRVTFDKYYDESNVSEMVSAFKSLISRLLGPDASIRVFEKVALIHPEIINFKEVLN